MGKESDMLVARVYLDLSRDKTFTEGERAVFRRLALRRGGPEIEILPEPPPTNHRKRRRAR